MAKTITTTVPIPTDHGQKIVTIEAKVSEETITYEGTEYSGVIVKETNTQLTKVKVSDTEDSKAVYGVHQVWAADAQDEGDMNVVGLGTFVVRVHKD